MIELKNDGLEFSFPEVHPRARLCIDLQRTLRIPDDGKTHHLPPGLGSFPLRHVDDFASRVPAQWNRHGGVMLPMYQSEAMWIHFHSEEIQGHWEPYPFAVKIAAGKIDAITGSDWTNELKPDPQNYAVVPEQPWLDGFCVEKGEIRQFVAMPLGAGYTAEEQLTGAAEHGGLQIQVFPMKRTAFEKRFPKGREDMRGDMREVMQCCIVSAPDMGLAPGGRMKQEIYEDPFRFDEWDLEHSSRCFLHIANSLVWRAITGEQPPTVPPTAEEYTRAGLPWFDYYDDALALDGSKALAELESVLEMGRRKGDVPLPENESVDVDRVVWLKRQPHLVREGDL